MIEQIESNFSREERLLFYILQELKEIKKELKCKEVEVVEDTELKQENKFICKKCGEAFDNRGKLLAHSKQHKKDGEL